MVDMVFAEDIALVVIPTMAAVVTKLMWDHVNKDVTENKSTSTSGPLDEIRVIPDAAFDAMMNVQSFPVPECPSGIATKEIGEIITPRPEGTGF